MLFFKNELAQKKSNRVGSAKNLTPKICLCEIEPHKFAP
jgi:hypothetical protein